MRASPLSRAGFFFLVSSLILLNSACAPVGQGVLAPDDHLLQQVLEPPAAVTPAMLAEAEASLLTMTEEMEHFVRAVTPEGGTPEARLDALFSTLRYNTAFAVEYDAAATLTAAEAFRQQRANCLAFSAMFIAMAREAGLDARFQEVDVPPSWDGQSNDTLVQFRHVNVSVRLNRREEGVVDFRIDRYSETYPRRLLTDEQALAQYHSNISMERLMAGQLAEAYVAAKRSVEADASQSFIWNNMGIVQRRLGNAELAEASYRQALTLDSKDWSAYSNLAVLLAQRGDPEEAQRLRARGDQIRLRNPYYRYALAQQAYRRGAYQEALAHLDAAVGRRSSEPRFYYLRGMSQWHLGDPDSAIKDMKKAIKTSNESGPLARYQQQLEEWQSDRG